MDMDIEFLRGKREIMADKIKDIRNTYEMKIRTNQYKDNDKKNIEKIMNEGISDMRKMFPGYLDSGDSMQEMNIKHKNIKFRIEAYPESSEITQKGGFFYRKIEEEHKCEGEVESNKSKKISNWCCL